ncbi:MAG: hypothetical protein HXY25_05150, partial [Alphaproteobacteria bacterium]|nr:hypothetical protein [Alphaproteobacteria bacterium]
LLIAVLAGRAPAPEPETAGPSRAPDAPREVVLIDPPDEPDTERFNPSTAEPYGLWEMFMPLPGQAPFRHVFEIRPEGTYTVDAGPYSHSGRINFTGRVYTLKSQTSVYEDGGAFFRPDPDTIVFEGRAGRSVWTRVTAPGYFDIDPSRHNMPVKVAEALARLKAEMREGWRPDAEPVRLEIERNQHGIYQMKVSFHSPADGTGMTVTRDRFRSSEFAMGGVNWFVKPLPESFIDPGEAAQALGTRAPIKRAQLGYFNRRGGGNTFDAAAPVGWSLLAEAGPSGLVDAGQALRR